MKTRQVILLFIPLFAICVLLIKIDSEAHSFYAQMEEKTQNIYGKLYTVSGQIDNSNMYLGSIAGYDKYPR